MCVTRLQWYNWNQLNYYQGRKKICANTFIQIREEAIFEPMNIFPVLALTSEIDNLIFCTTKKYMYVSSSKIDELWSEILLLKQYQFSASVRGDNKLSKFNELKICCKLRLSLNLFLLIVWVLKYK